VDTGAVLGGGTAAGAFEAAFFGAAAGGVVVGGADAAGAGAATRPVEVPGSVLILGVSIGVEVSALELLD
jgi:hypothetical protein